MDEQQESPEELERRARQSLIDLEKYVEEMERNGYPQQPQLDSSNRDLYEWELERNSFVNDGSGWRPRPNWTPSTYPPLEQMPPEIAGYVDTPKHSRMYFYYNEPERLFQWFVPYEIPTLNKMTRNGDGTYQWNQKMSELYHAWRDLSPSMWLMAKEMDGYMERPNTNRYVLFRSAHIYVMAIVPPKDPQLASDPDNIVIAKWPIDMLTYNGFLEDDDSRSVSVSLDTFAYPISHKSVLVTLKYQSYDDIKRNKERTIGGFDTVMLQIGELSDWKNSGKGVK